MKVKSVASFDTSNPFVLKVTWNHGTVSIYDIRLLSEAIRDQLAWHGTKQKTMDAHASTFKETGSSAECQKDSDAVWANLLQGDFNSDRTGAPWIVECLADLYDLEESEAAEIHAALPKAEKSELLKDLEVVKWKANRDIARASTRESKIDAKSLFAKKAVKKPAK